MIHVWDTLCGFIDHNKYVIFIVAHIMLILQLEISLILV
jgi:hypothetical protein